VTHILDKKNPRHRPYGLLQPLPIPNQSLSSLSIDFIIDSPPSSSFDTIFVVIVGLTKMIHFVLCKKTIIRKRRASLFLDNIY